MYEIPLVLTLNFGTKRCVLHTGGYGTQSILCGERVHLD